jgi:lysophospholipase L1-like esterase
MSRTERLLPLALLLSAAQADAAPAASPPGNCPLGAFVDDSALSTLREALLDPAQAENLGPGVAAMRARLDEVRAAAAAQREVDWAFLCRYRPANAELARSGREVRVVLLGDSITEYWQHAKAAPSDQSLVNRGISGQTSSQLLLRFPHDVTALKPRAVHLLIGTNDIAGNGGPMSDEVIIGNVRAMIDIAQANGITVLLGSIPPARSFPWAPEAAPATRIVRLNRLLKDLAAKRGAVFLDYHAALVDTAGGMQARLANDGVHPNDEGYKAMMPTLALGLRTINLSSK